MTHFADSRAAFGRLSFGLRNDPELADEVLRSFVLLLSRFNTAIRENRFIVGGVAERIIAAAFREIGDPSSNAGVEVTRTDIWVGGARFSVKGSFQPKRSSIRLVNVMGSAPNAAWEEGTIFVLAGMGIGYADPDLLPDRTRRRTDVIELPTRPLYDLWRDQPDLLVQMNIPAARDDVEGSDIASRVIADEILRYMRRLKPFDPRSPRD